MNQKSHYAKALFLLLPAFLPSLLRAEEDSPFYKGELIFPIETYHNHGSSIVECPNGDLLACWYHGSGERKADDVLIQGARRLTGHSEWSERFVLADTLNYPDCNPTMFIDCCERLWLIWATIIDNQWETAILKYRISSNYQQASHPPDWDWQDILHVTPNDFSGQFRMDGIRFLKNVILIGWNNRGEIYHDCFLYGGGIAILLIGFLFFRIVKVLRRHKMILQKFIRYILYALVIVLVACLYLNNQLNGILHNKRLQRMGWMTRNHPLVLPSGAILIPLYSDTFSLSIIAITKDLGKTWQCSEPLIGFGNIQPSLVIDRSGTIFSLMRDNFFLVRRIRRAYSTDEGLTWSPVTETNIPNPGSSLVYCNTNVLTIIGFHI